MTTNNRARVQTMLTTPAPHEPSATVRRDHQRVAANRADILDVVAERALGETHGLDEPAYGRSDKNLPPGAYQLDPVPCLGCKLLTYGCFSVGGHHLRAVCRPCKDAADAQEERRMVMLVSTVETILPKPAHTCGLCHSAKPFVDGRCPDCDWDGVSKGDDRDPGYTDRERCDGLDD